MKIIIQSRQEFRFGGCSDRFVFVSYLSLDLLPVGLQLVPGLGSDANVPVQEIRWSATFSLMMYQLTTPQVTVYQENASDLKLKSSNLIFVPVGLLKMLQALVRLAAERIVRSGTRQTSKHYCHLRHLFSLLTTQRRSMATCLTDLNRRYSS